LHGGFSKERPWLNDLANQENYVNPQCPPFLFLHGTRDQVVPVLGSLHFAASLVAEIGEENVKYTLVEGAGHDIHDFEKEWIYDLEADFLKKKLNCINQ